MSELNYGRLLEAVKVQAKRNEIPAEASKALDRVLKFPHPNRELAFLDWALNSDLYELPTEATGPKNLTHDQMSV